MPQLSFRPNRAYPSIPTISGDSQSHTNALYAIREAIEIHERRTSNYLDSFVRVQELVDLGLITLDGNVVVDPDDDADGSGTHHHDSLYIRLDGTSPATSGQVEFGAGIDVVGNIVVNSQLRILGPASLFVQERAADAADMAGWGQIWVRDDVPNTLWFTNDVGDAIQLGSGGGDETLLWLGL
jgi:hypothetical protein